MIKKILTLDNVPVINRKIGKVDTMEKLKASTIYSIGDVVEVLGYYTAGDGAHHNRKIESADDGSGVQLANGLWANIVHNGEVNMSWFGASFDLNKVLANTTVSILNLENKKIELDYTVQITRSNITIKNGDFVFFDKHISDKDVLMSVVGDIETPLSNIAIDNIRIDYSKQLNKGGSKLSPEKPCVRPYYKHTKAIYCKHIIGLSITNCKITEVFGDGVNVMKCYNVKVDRNTLIDVGGASVAQSNPEGSSETYYDFFGDGIVVFSSRNSEITNNIISNSVKFESSDDFGATNLNNNILKCYRARTGIEYEYPIDRYEEIMNPFNEDNNKDGECLIIRNNIVSGYAKGVHLEAKVKVLVENNYFYDNHIEAIVSTECCVFSRNTFNKKDETWIQKGYDVYSGCLATTSYGDRNERGSTIIRDNVFMNGTSIACDRSINIIDSNVIYGGGVKTTDNQYARAYLTRINFTNNYVENPHFRAFRSYGSRFDMLFEGNTIINTDKDLGYSYPQDVEDIEFFEVAQGRLEVKNNLIRGCKFAITSNMPKVNFSGNVVENVNTFISNRGAEVSLWSNSITFKDSVMDTTYSYSRVDFLDNIFLSNSEKSIIFNHTAGSGSNLKFLNNRVFGNNVLCCLFNYHTGNNIIKNNISNNMTNILRQQTSGAFSGVESDNLNFSTSDTNVFYLSELNTPYHTAKMQQLGIYEDFISYMDSQHEYDKEQKALETAKQEAYQLALSENSELVYEDWLASYPELMPVHQEPVPSEALQAFYDEYR